ncbi:hypothetical protein BZA77DRAFT_301640 [Pyronema omphalodes]|nr:hypothetical protein BZA77DRAFT_301640 [Pyronema omphalodes]
MKSSRSWRLCLWVISEITVGQSRVANSGADEGYKLILARCLQFFQRYKTYRATDDSVHIPPITKRRSSYLTPSPLLDFISMIFWRIDVTANIDTTLLNTRGSITSTSFVRSE